MRHLHHLPLLFLPANLALAQILVFNETTGLPVCAFDCNPLWAAQYACSGLASGDAVKCFCVEVGWVQGGSGGSGNGNGSGWGRCDNACGDSGGGRVRVKEWLGRVCGVGSGSNGDNNGGSGRGPGETGGRGNEGSTAPPNNNGTNTTNPAGPTQDAADQAAKARAWWKKNYPFFILAFLVVTVPILLYAFAIPIRKWAKRQIIKSRPRRQSNMEQLGSGGFIFPRSAGGSAVWATGAPTTGSCGSFMGGGGGGGSRRGSAANALDGPSSNGVFTTEVLPPPQQPPRDTQVSARQASWERRVRAQFSRGNGFRLKFWKKTREGDEEG
ncbi:hypothetical protein HOY80DRAFT_1042084 [Tuber brumale]|nr:hypothetical protein HOY80DRAFT_1042084 [Tuber brumale]